MLPEIQVTCHKKYFINSGVFILILMLIFFFFFFFPSIKSQFLFLFGFCVLVDELRDNIFEQYTFLTINMVTINNHLLSRIP